MIYEALSETPITKKVLAEKLGVKPRKVEGLVQRARLEGVPIVSSGDGYWISTDPEQIRGCAEWLRSKFITQAETVAALERTATRLEGVKQTALPWAA